MPNDSYWPIEPDLPGLLNGKSDYFDYAVAIYYWLIPHLYAVLENELQDVELFVAENFYLRGCPCIALKHPGIGKENDWDETIRLETLIVSTISKVISETPSVELIDFITKDNIDWTAETLRILNYPNSLPAPTDAIQRILDTTKSSTNQD